MRESDRSVEQVAGTRDRSSRNPVGRALMRRGGSRYVREDATTSCLATSLW